MTRLELATFRVTVGATSPMCRFPRPDADIWLWTRCCDPLWRDEQKIRRGVRWSERNSAIPVKHGGTLCSRPPLPFGPAKLVAARLRRATYTSPASMPSTRWLSSRASSGVPLVPSPASTTGRRESGRRHPHRRVWLHIRAGSLDTSSRHAHTLKTHKRHLQPSGHQ